MLVRSASAVFFLSLIVFTGRATADVLETDNLFGADQRQPVTSTAMPWRTIGKTSTGCTATLVAPNLALTAAHCVIDPATKKLRTDITYFYPNMIDGKSKDPAWIDWVWWGTSDPDNYRASDWAILRLTKRIGDTYGWMGIEDNTSQRQVTLVGYSADFRGGRTAGVHVGCWIREFVSGMLYHDCHNTRGASGGPMFAMKNGHAYIYAINAAEFRNGGEVSLKLPSYSTQYANIGVPASAFLAKVKELKGD